MSCDRLHSLQQRLWGRTIALSTVHILFDCRLQLERIGRRGLWFCAKQRQTWHLLLILLVLETISGQVGFAQDFGNRRARLSEGYFKDGGITLRAFVPVTKTARDSIVEFEIDGKSVALGAIIEASGLAITKASEIKEGKLTCKLANGVKANARSIAVDDDNDVALVQIGAKGLKPIKWASQEISVGEWAVTPGIEITPEAVGIISVPPRKILHKQARIGVVLDFNTSSPKISEVLTGLGAEKAGLKPGDIIVAVNERPIGKREELTSTLRTFRHGQTVKLRVRRDEEEFDVSIQMTTAKPENTWRGGDRQERMNRLGGELSQRAEGFDLAIQHDTVLQPWQCGGPLINLDGKAIGLNIARAGRAASYALPAGLVKQIITDLQRQAQNAKHNVTSESSQ